MQVHQSSLPENPTFKVTGSINPETNQINQRFSRAHLSASLAKTKKSPEKDFPGLDWSQSGKEVLDSIGPGFTLRRVALTALT